MAIKTYAQQLDDVQTAIASIESGAQTVTYGDRTVTRGNLKTLYEREQWLRKMVDRESTGGLRVRGVRVAR